MGFRRTVSIRKYKVPGDAVFRSVAARREKKRAEKMLKVPWTWSRSHRAQVWSDTASALRMAEELEARIDLEAGVGRLVESRWPIV